jgi:NarL family two-component system response regulator YdfI
VSRRRRGGDSEAASVFIIAASDVVRAGLVRGLLPRGASGPEIIAALGAVASGLVALDAAPFTALLSAPPQTADERLPPAGAELDALTPREREVLHLLASGLSNKEIAWQMKISEHTVKSHVASIFAKLEVSTRTEAVTQGIRKGLIMM